MNIERIVREISAGNLVITPTDTVYGILADATNLEAIEKVYAAKCRAKSKPLLLLASDVKMLENYTEELCNLEKDLVRDFLPGKLTVLLPRNGRVYDAVVDGGKLVGVRIPDQPELIEIIRRVGKPLVSTSANLADEETATNPKLLSRKLLDNVAYVENVGVIKGTPSTIVKVEGGRIVILREGEVAQEIREKYEGLVFE